MTIESLKDLQKLIALCRKTGVESIKVDGIEFHLGRQPDKASKPQPEVITDPLAHASIPMFNGIPAQTANAGEADKIITDELTEEELMFYSARAEEEGARQ